MLTHKSTLSHPCALFFFRGAAFSSRGFSKKYLSVTQWDWPNLSHFFCTEDIRTAVVRASSFDHNENPYHCLKYNSFCGNVPVCSQRLTCRGSQTCFTLAQIFCRQRTSTYQQPCQYSSRALNGGRRK